MFGRNLSSDDMHQLLGALRHNTSIMQLDLGMTCLDQAALEILASVLCHNTCLQTILLPGCGIDNKGAEILQKALPFNFTLRELVLSDGLPLDEPRRNRIDLECLSAIEGMLKYDAR